MILLQASQLSRQFADVTLYEDVTFTIHSQDRIALVGRNGTGKTTLIRQIMGKEPISSGDIAIARDLSIGYLEQHTALNSNRTIWEEMLSVFDDTLKLRQQAQEASQKVADLADRYESQAYQEALKEYDRLQEALSQRNAYAIESDIRTVLHGFRFYEDDYDRSVADLSGGQQTRLALAQTLLKDHDLLILDEPTNHLDMETLTWLEGYLHNYRGALLVVSHDRYFLDKVTHRVLELRHQRLYTYEGNYSFYLQDKEHRLQQELATYEQQQEKIAKMEDFIQRNIVHAVTSGRAKSRRKQLERMNKIDRPLQDPKAPRIQFIAEKTSGDRVIEAIDLDVGYSKATPLVQHIDFDLRQQEAIAVVGPNGIGKSTLLKTLMQELEPLGGEILYGTNVTLGYYDQNVNHLNPRLSVLETLWQPNRSQDEVVIRGILGSFLFTGEDVEKSVQMLSGGEKARLSLALLAMQHDNTLLLDEPTNHLDIDSKEVLEDALVDFNGTLFFVSHDRYFINRIATQVLELSEDGATIYLGDYDYYLSKKEEQASSQQVKVEETSKQSSSSMSTNQRDYQKHRQLRRALRDLKKAIDDAVNQSEELDTRIHELEQAMAIEAQENNQEALNHLHQELSQAQELQLMALDTWETKSLALEQFYEDHPDMCH